MQSVVNKILMVDVQARKVQELCQEKDVKSFLVNTQLELIHSMQNKILMPDSVTSIHIWISIKTNFIWIKQELASLIIHTRYGLPSKVRLMIISS